jgi:hypothetical protein
MTLVADRQCWEIVDGDGCNWYADEEFLPHYRTRAEAAEQIAELHRDRDMSLDEPLILRAAMCNGGRICVKIRCNGCGDEFEDDGGANHFDPADQVHIAEYIGYAEWQAPCRGFAAGTTPRRIRS